ncbi:NADH-quinone oxidoreductase subunit NuoF [bacterium]|nr:NADH-quinone oxidoreductase subunit NuoF [bacterium]
MNRIKSPEEMESLIQQIIQERGRSEKIQITLCGGTGCHAYNCQMVIDAFEQGIEKGNLSERVGIKVTGCHGFCERGVLVVIKPSGVFYQQVKPEDVPEILSAVISGEIVERLLYRDLNTKSKITHEEDVPFYKKQTRFIFGHNGEIDPTRIEDYIAIKGYAALGKVLSGMPPEQIIEEIKKSGLRGRGGGGFPTGIKWETTRKAPGEPRYVICNADEGDPGAYMDRSLLEGNPHLVMEGMIIGAYAIGSSLGYVYVRNEYPLAVKNVETAIEQARGYGLLGRDIMGSGFDFDIKVVRGGGAFVCGESTALFASIEGRIGEPRAKYIRSAERGLWDKPTNLNNVETWANVPLIINKGADWYAKIGTENSKGTKIFSLVGKINNTGLVEVPMGITLREIVNDIGGGIPKKRRFKAVQTGGPSGGCIPEDFLDTPVDFDELTKVGSMMGSGGMIVMDDHTCMVDIARYFLEFLKNESCGKCVPCREGVWQMHNILSEICSGNGKESDLDLLMEIGETITAAALCGLGTTAPNPVMSTLRYFRDEYESHIKDKRCPSGACKELVTFIIDVEKCNGCGVCKKNCPQGAIIGEKKETHTLDGNKCTKCGICFEDCPFGAVMVR